MVSGMLRIPSAFIDEIVARCRAEMPNEACGLMAGRDGVATRNYPMVNAERSPVLYRMEPDEQFKVFSEIEAEDLDLVCIWHSHTKSPAYPSSTDVELAFYPEVLYLIISMANPESPDVKFWRITERRHITAAEVEIF